MQAILARSLQDISEGSSRERQQWNVIMWLKNDESTESGPEGVSKENHELQKFSKKLSWKNLEKYKENVCPTELNKSKFLSLE